MIFAVARIVLQLLRRAGFNVPQLPSLRMRRTLLERALDPATDPATHPAEGLHTARPLVRRRFTRRNALTATIGIRDPDWG